MYIPAPSEGGTRSKMRWLQPFAILGGLVALLLLLSGVAQAASLGGQAAAPAKQASTSPMAADQNGDQRSVATYLESKGYQVTGVGYPTSGGNEIDGYVAVSMALASESFDPKTGLQEDTDTITQVIYGFNALHHYYPDYPNLVVILEWRDYLLWFPIDATTFQSYLDEETEPNDMWAVVTDGFAAFNTQTNEQLGAKDFGNKDFSGNGDNGMPPVDPNSGASNVGSTDNPKGPIRVRLQPSSAYLPTDGELIRLIATVNDADNRRVSNRDVQFTASQTGEDPQELAVSKTGVDGVARTDLRSDQEVGAISLAARPDTSDISNQGDAVGAASSILVGPVPTSEDEMAQAITDGLQTFGYDTGDIGYQGEDENSLFGYAIMGMASSRFDDAVRTQILTGFGTIFRVYPTDISSARVGVVYGSRQQSYLLLYTINRGEWDSFIAGSIDEGRLWQAITLYVLDGQTGEPVGDKNFTDKNFTGGTSEDAIGRTVTTQLVKESWGDQLYSAQVSVPFGAYADNFNVAALSGTGVFAIYLASNPTTPIYSSTSDSNAAKLKALVLQQGEYMLTISSGAPPISVQLTYIEHTLR